MERLSNLLKIIELVYEKVWIQILSLAPELALLTSVLLILTCYVTCTLFPNMYLRLTFCFHLCLWLKSYTSTKKSYLHTLHAKIRFCVSLIKAMPLSLLFLLEPSLQLSHPIKLLLCLPGRGREPLLFPQQFTLMFFSLKPCFPMHFLCPFYSESLILQLFEGTVISHSAPISMPEKKKKNV